MALLAQGRVVNPPVDVEFCATISGIQLVTYSKLGAHSAILSVPYGIPGVVVNVEHSKVRQRFSLAHEIGHWVLERAPATHDLRPIAARGRRYDALERVCDYFAVCLLMPRSWVGSFMREREWMLARPDLVDNIARIFRVSPVAAEIRLVELGHIERRSP
jgi:Zn-dependent peptidase ImmA (M78 family)